MPPMVGPSTGAIWTCNGEGMCCVACRPYANAGPSSVGRDNCQLYMHTSTLFAGTASHKSSLAAYTVPIPPMMSIYRPVHFGACFILLYVSMPVKLDAINGDRPSLSKTKHTHTQKVTNGAETSVSRPIRRRGAGIPHDRYRMHLRMK